MNWRLRDSDWLVSERQGSTVSAFFPSAGLTGHCVQLLRWVLGSELRSLCLCDRDSTD